MSEHDEHCDLCDDKVDYCTCERCFTCERLFPPYTDGMTTDEDGETLCPFCLHDSNDYIVWVGSANDHYDNYDDAIAAYKELVANGYGGDVALGTIE